MGTEGAILVSALLATTGWLYSGRLQRAMNRRQHTYQVISRQQDDEKFDPSLKRVRLILEKASIPDPQDSTREDDILKIDYLLNHYEFLSAAILCGDIDENLIRLCEEARIVKLFREMNGYIAANRDLFKQPSMWINIEIVAARWQAGPRAPVHRFYEWWIDKPAPRAPPAVARLDRWLSRMK